jgi:RNA polymerase sigma factor (sigma-70 family)
MRTEDGHFIGKCLNGEIDAFGFLVDKYRESIFAFAYSKLCNVDDAEDVTQEVFLKAYKDLRSLRRWDSFATWLYSITNNICKNYLRTQARRIDKKLVANQDSVTYKFISPNSESDDPMLDSLNEALNILPEIYRQVLTLYYISGKNSEEIARFLSISPSAVRQRLSRARSELREEILAMISMTFEQKKLPVGFTFRIMEMVKRIKINPVSQTKGLPWGISLATGILVAVLSFNSHFMPLELFGTYGGSPLPMEQKVLKIGEMPVDVLKISNIAMLSNQKGNGNGGEFNRQNSFFMAPQGEGEWTKKADMPTARYLTSTCVVKGKIYAIGGRAGIQLAGPVYATTEEYDPVADKWTKKADMLTARDSTSIAVVNNKIYVIGGSPVAGFLAAVEEYDPVADKWTKKADMPNGRTGLSASVVNGKIYVIGGMNNIVCLPTVEEYDPVADIWTRKTDMPSSRGSHSASVVNGKIYVIGGGATGWIPVSTVEEYDPVTDKWTKKADMPTARYGLSTSVVNGKIYAIGGGANGFADVFSAVEEYDPVADIWTKKADMPFVRYGPSTSAVNGKIYVIGGTGKNWIDIFSTVEAYDTGFVSESVDAKGKLPTTWGQKKQR